MVGFAGYDMPVQFPRGILSEHLWTREKAGLFDVSHMGQLSLHGAGADRALESLVPGDIQALKPGRMRYTMLTNDAGGILDDLMVTRGEDRLILVVNAACKGDDIAHLRANLPSSVALEEHPDLALLALQGPMAVAVLEALAPGASMLGFMSGAPLAIAGIPCFVTRSGYTGEDGFEISVPGEKADSLARALLADERVAPIGLGARDSLRLEAGLCLYGHDIDTTTTPVEADLVWTMSKRRREDGGFPGDARIKRELDLGPQRRRVGIQPEGRAPAREHTEIRFDGSAVGEITSGGFGPTCQAPVAMGYVRADLAVPGTKLDLIVRDQPRPAAVASLPFAPHRYYRG